MDSRNSVGVSMTKEIDTYLQIQRRRSNEERLHRILSEDGGACLPACLGRRCHRSCDKTPPASLSFPLKEQNRNPSGWLVVWFQSTYNEKRALIILGWKSQRKSTTNSLRNSKSPHPRARNVLTE
ncbi:hypothetical protein OIU85_028022 [Salix viminalis]|uniref:Uncharacterized protein n=1 Tax=Salix viminalis TaxID=40686 RepID=A0A9Q0QJ96_SALVM|nr:hypothetical protein OIU85_028022 [Salix viminalis]